MLKIGDSKKAAIILLMWMILVTGLGVFVYSTVDLGPDTVTTGTVNASLWYSMTNNVTDILNYPQMVSSYIVMKSGSTFYGKNCTTGLIDNSSSDPAVVVNYCLAQLSNGGIVYIRYASNFTTTTTVAYTGSNQNIIMEDGVIWNYTGTGYAFKMDTGDSVLQCGLKAGSIYLGASADAALYMNMSLYANIDIANITGTDPAGAANYTTGQYGIVLEGSNYCYLNDITLRQFVSLDTAIMVGTSATNYNANANKITITGTNGGTGGYVAKFFGGLNRFNFYISMGSMENGLLFSGVYSLANTGFMYYEANAASLVFNFTGGATDNYIECVCMNGLLGNDASWGDNICHFLDGNQFRGTPMTLYSEGLTFNGTGGSYNITLNQNYLKDPAYVGNVTTMAQLSYCMIIRIGDSNYYVPVFAAAANGSVYVNRGYATGTGSEQAIAHGLITGIGGTNLVPTVLRLFPYTTANFSAYQSNPANATHIFVTAQNTTTYMWEVEYTHAVG